MNLCFLLLLISFIIRSVQSIPVDSIVEKLTDNNKINTENDAEYGLTNETEVISPPFLCQNGGVNLDKSLGDDWCGCPPGFTGRRCEVKMQSQNGCGTKIILF